MILKQVKFINTIQFQSLEAFSFPVITCGTFAPNLIQIKHFLDNSKHFCSVLCTLHNLSVFMLWTSCVLMNK